MDAVPVTPVPLHHLSTLEMASSESESEPEPTTSKQANMCFRRNGLSYFRVSDIIKQPISCIAFIAKSSAKAWLATLLFLSEHRRALTI